MCSSSQFHRGNNGATRRRGARRIQSANPAGHAAELNLGDDLDVETEAREAAARVAERRIIRSGLDARNAINKAESFDGWLTIGRALSIGKAHALKVTGNAAWSRSYSREFGLWMQQHGFASMPKSTRSVAVELHEHGAEITAWRQTLPERQRKRLVHPLSNVRRWRASTQCDGRCPQDIKRDAVAAWRKFLSCVQALPQDDALPLWRIVSEAAAAHA